MVSRPATHAILFASTLLGGAYALAQGAAGPMTQAQVAAGHADYDANCAGCHGVQLNGQGDAPALSGRGFASSWGGRSTKDFYQYISTVMPYGAAGTLSEQAYTNIAAYIYAANGARPGAQAYGKATEVRISALLAGAPAAGAPPASAAAPAAAPPAQLAQATPPGGAPRPGGAAPARPGSARAADGPRSAVEGEGGGGGDGDAPRRPPAGPAFPLGYTVPGMVKNYVDVTQDMLERPADGDWLMYRRNYQGWSYSPLKDITPQNVAALQLKWSWTMNDGGAVEVTPIVHGNVMFLSNTSNTVQALDTKTGELIWENRLGPVSVAAYGGTRSLAIYKDKVFVAATDATLYALDARTGKTVWKTKIADGKGNTSGVMVIHGKVLTGMMQCDNYATTNCFISAYDSETGKRDWQFFTTALEGTPGGDTWNGLPNQFRAGTDTWIAGTYDPTLNTTYWGVAQAKPWFRASRQTGAGAALYSTSTLALDPDTGKLKWYFQHIPGESLDLDEVFERVLIDHGDQKTAMTIGKSGILWKLDRVTGKFVSLKQTMVQNVYAKVDEKTGAITYRKDLLDQKTGQWFGSCPGPEGGHDWMATSYNQPTDLMIIPLSQSCVMIRGNEVDQKVGGGGTAASQQFYFMPNTGENMGKLVAINTTTMKEEWSWQQRSPFLTAVLSTGGGVAFIGDFDRRFKAIDVRTGKVLWQTRLGQTVQGYPVSFTVDGRQYIAVTTGTGGGSPQQKPSTLLHEVHRPVQGTGHQIYVFALPGGDD